MENVQYARHKDLHHLYLRLPPLRPRLSVDTSNGLTVFAQPVNRDCSLARSPLYYICIDSKTKKKRSQNSTLPLLYYICISGHAPLDTLANLHSGYFITKRRRYPTTPRSIQNKLKRLKT